MAASDFTVGCDKGRTSVPLSPVRRHCGGVADGDPGGLDSGSRSATVCWRDLCSARATDSCTHPGGAEAAGGSNVGVAENRG